MSDTITINDLKSRQDELAALISQFEQQCTTVPFQIQAETIDLHAGETYCGAIRNEDGTVKHHLVMLPPTGQEATHDGAMEAVAGLQAFAPTRQESLMLVVHAQSKLPSVFWTCERKGSSDAWYCYSDGSQSDFFCSAELGVVAVRRVAPSVL